MAEFSGRAAGPGQGRQAQPGHTTLMGGAFQSPPGAPRGAVTMDWKLLYWMNFTGVLLFFKQKTKTTHVQTQHRL